MVNFTQTESLRNRRPRRLSCIISRAGARTTVCSKIMRRIFCQMLVGLFPWALLDLRKITLQEKDKARNRMTSKVTRTVKRGTCEADAHLEENEKTEKAKKKVTIDHRSRIPGRARKIAKPEIPLILCTLLKLCSRSVSGIVSCNSMMRNKVGSNSYTHSRKQG